MRGRHDHWAATERAGTVNNYAKGQCSIRHVRRLCCGVRRARSARSVLGHQAKSQESWPSISIPLCSWCQELRGKVAASALLFPGGCYPPRSLSGVTTFAVSIGIWLMAAPEFDKGTLARTLIGPCGQVTGLPDRRPACGPSPLVKFLHSDRGGKAARPGPAPACAARSLARGGMREGGSGGRVPGHQPPGLPGAALARGLGRAGPRP